MLGTTLILPTAWKSAASPGQTHFRGPLRPSRPPWFAAPRPVPCCGGGLRREEAMPWSSGLPLSLAPVEVRGITAACQIWIRSWRPAGCCRVRECGASSCGRGGVVPTVAGVSVPTAHKCFVLGPTANRAAMAWVTGRRASLAERWPRVSPTLSGRYGLAPPFWGGKTQGSIGLRCAVCRADRPDNLGQERHPHSQRLALAVARMRHCVEGACWYPLPNPRAKLPADTAPSHAGVTRDQCSPLRLPVRTAGPNSFPGHYPLADRIL